MKTSDIAKIYDMQNFIDYLDGRLKQHYNIPSEIELWKALQRCRSKLEYCLIEELDVHCKLTQKVVEAVKE